ncbi:hypothetical protein ES705_22828 [subsurface metagenome]
MIGRILVYDRGFKKVIHVGKKKFQEGGQENGPENNSPGIESDTQKKHQERNTAQDDEIADEYRKYNRFKIVIFLVLKFFKEGRNKDPDT